MQQWVLVVLLLRRRGLRQPVHEKHRQGGHQQAQTCRERFPVRYLMHNTVRSILSYQEERVAYHARFPVRYVHYLCMYVIIEIQFS